MCVAYKWEDNTDPLVHATASKKAIGKAVAHSHAGAGNR